MKYLSYIKNIFIIFAIFEYFNILSHSEASYMPYILWGILGICAIIYNKYTNNKNINNISKVGAVLFSVMISFVNYKAIYKSIYYWKQYIDYIFLIKYIVFFIGIYVLFVNIIDLILKNKFKITLYKNVINNDKFIYYYMIFIFVVYNLVYILGFYPGILTFDSMSQLTQVINNNYSNHHPVSHTYLIGFVLSLFKNQPNNNLAIFAFCEMQIIIFMLMHAYAYFVAKANKSLNILLVLLPLLNIINIFYSFTLWKDILFNYAIFLFVVEIFKLLNEKSIKIYDYAIIIITSFCICLFRSNGLIALFLFFIMSLVYIYIYIYI